jgi:carbonic anhydrase/acetyltransferase-like protein (isoleucine patch superfamily)
MSEQLRIARPTIGKNVFIAPTAYVGGEVVIGDDCTIMHHVTIRGDVSAITIGRWVNVQDGTVIHTLTGVPLEIGDEVVIGHRAVVHCRKVGRRVLIGIGAIVLDDCEIGDGAIIAAGAVLSPGTIVPPGKLVAGVPGKVVRDVTAEQARYVEYALKNYARLNRDHAAGRYPNWNQ